MRPLEASFQDEFYRAASNILLGVGLSSECYDLGDGHIDFVFIPGPGWGAELPCNRFRPNALDSKGIDEEVGGIWLMYRTRHRDTAVACGLTITPVSTCRDSSAPSNWGIRNPPPRDDLIARETTRNWLWKCLIHVSVLWSVYRDAWLGPSRGAQILPPTAYCIR